MNEDKNVASITIVVLLVVIVVLLLNITVRLPLATLPAQEKSMETNRKATP